MGASVIITGIRIEVVSMACLRSEMLSMIVSIRKEAEKKKCQCCLKILKQFQDLVETAAYEELRREMLSYLP